MISFKSFINSDYVTCSSIDPAEDQGRPWCGGQDAVDVPLMICSSGGVSLNVLLFPTVLFHSLSQPYSATEKVNQHTGVRELQTLSRFKQLNSLALLSVCFLAFCFTALTRSARLNFACDLVA